MNNIEKELYELGIIPVAKLENAQDAIPLAKALYAGGLRVVEITFRTNAAAESINLITKQMPEMLVGAGTVLTTEQVDRAMGVGAKFIVTPGFNEKVVCHCIEKGIPVVPGCNTPQSIEAALSLGLTVLKFFPAESSGGLATIKHLSGPYSNVRFIPTGGINYNNLVDYLSHDSVIAIGGTWLVEANLIKAGKFAEIEQLTREAIHKMHGFELLHVGINCDNAEIASKEANRLQKLLGWPAKEGNSSIFVGPAFEIMKTNYLGRHGHIAIAVNSVDRVYAYLSRLGYKFREDTAKRDNKGKLNLIYLEEEFNGFAIHLVNKK